MALEIIITSGNKGSNPGGRCLVRTDNFSFPSYIKYCTNTQIHNSTLTPQHQPIYEAMFLEMAKKMGLSVPDYFVILNKGGNKINFSYFPDKDEKPMKLRDNNSTYFVSKLISHPIIETDSLLEVIMHKEKIYRDLLNIGDISGRPQNYTLITPNNGKPFAMYIDLGCGLVDTHESNMTLRKSLNRKVRSIGFDDKSIKDLKKRLGKVFLKTNDGRSSINLLEFGEKIPKCCNIKVLFADNPQKITTLSVTELIKEAELDYLGGLYFLVNTDFLSKYKDDPRLSSSI